jgi:GNAT superfamily N-acetyltransferase
MANVELVTAVDVRLMQGLAQRVTAIRPDLVNSDASFGELAWNWGRGHAGEGASRRRRLWFSGGDPVAWGWAHLPHQVRRSDGSVKDVSGAYLAYQVHPDHAGLVEEVIDWYDGAAAGIERTVMPGAADAFALKRWAAHGYETDPASLGDAGSWTQLNEANRTAEFEPVGTHPAYRRRGLARAMLLHGMHLARATGAIHMTVACLGAPGHPAARGLYYSVGFRFFTRDAPLIKTTTAG